MASSNKDETMEYDKPMYQKPEQHKILLAGFADKLKEKANQTQIPPPPLANSVYR
jgi:hypothetical protein